jgi:TRAP transporter TAXI family solute receptor
MKYYITAISIVMTFAMSSSLTAQTLGLGTSAQGGINHALGSALATVLSKKTGMQVRVQPFSGTSQTLPLLNLGELDLGINNVSEFDFAVRGGNYFKNKRQKNLRLVGVLIPYHIGIAVRKDSDIKSLADLRGKRVPTTYSGQKIAWHLVRALLANGGLGTGELKGLPVPNVGRGANDFATGKADAFFFAIGAGKVAETSAKVGGIRFLPLDTSSAAVARMRKIIPNSFITRLKPSKRFVGIEGPTDAMGDVFVLIAGSHVSDDVDFNITKSIYEVKKDQVKAHRAYRLYSPDQMVKPYRGLTYHSGAIRYYSQKKVWQSKN